MPEDQKEAPMFRWEVGINPSQLVDVAFQVNRSQEIRKSQQVAVFLETALGKQERWGLRGRWKAPPGAIQCACYKEEGQWRKDCPELKINK